MTADTVHDPKASATYRALRAVVIILGILIVLALGALIVGGAMKLARNRSAAAASPTTVGAELPPGAKIISVETSGDRVVVGLHTSEGDEVDIFDTQTGHAVARIRPAPPGSPK